MDTPLNKTANSIPIFLGSIFSIQIYFSDMQLLTALLVGDTRIKIKEFVHAILKSLSDYENRDL